MNHQQLQYTPPERQMRSKSPHHLITVSDSSKPPKRYLCNLDTSQLEPTSSPNVSPGPRPIIRPIPSPMTPITPLVLTESHYQKEFLHSSINNSHDPNQYGYFYHGNNIQHYQSPLSQLPHRYGYHNQYGYSISHPTQPSVSFTPGSPSPLSSGASTPTYSTCLSSSSPNQLTIHNNYGDEDSFQSNVVSTDDEEDLCHDNTFLAQSEDEGDMFRDLIITNPLDANLYYQNPHLGYQQKSQYEMVANEIGKCQDVDVNVHGTSHGGDAYGCDTRNGGVHGANDVEHPMSTGTTNINEMMANNNGTPSQNNDLRFHEILKGMTNMGIADFH